MKGLKARLRPHSVVQLDIHFQAPILQDREHTSA